MIAAGLAAEANAAVEELRAALDSVGISLPLSVDPHVWDSAERGPVRLVELGAVLPERAVTLAAVIRKGAADAVADERAGRARKECVPLAELRRRSGELAVHIEAHLAELWKR